MRVGIWIIWLQTRETNTMQTRCSVSICWSNGKRNGTHMIHTKGIKRPPRLKWERDYWNEWYEWQNTDIQVSHPIQIHTNIQFYATPFIIHMQHLWDLMGRWSAKVLLTRSNSPAAAKFKREAKWHWELFPNKPTPIPPNDHLQISLEFYFIREIQSPTSFQKGLICRKINTFFRCSSLNNEAKPVSLLTEEHFF